MLFSDALLYCPPVPEWLVLLRRLSTLCCVAYQRRNASFQNKGNRLIKTEKRGQSQRRPNHLIGRYGCWYRAGQVAFRRNCCVAPTDTQNINHLYVVALKSQKYRTPTWAGWYMLKWLQLRYRHQQENSKLAN